jgi:hypothetical protein
MSKKNKNLKVSKVLPFEYIIIQGEKVKYIQCEDKIVKKNNKFSKMSKTGYNFMNNEFNRGK